MSELGKLVQVDLRKVWEHEARDFSAWLVKPENLGALAEQIGIEIVPIGTEVEVGRFRIDILAKEPNTNEHIIIENQLEPTNHDHLGKVITYAAGLDARYLIWIVKDVLPEHLKAIEWLNEHLDDSIRCFLIRIEVWQIGNSLPAPRFEIISAKNDWAATLKQAAINTELSDLQLKQLEFWTNLSDYIRTKDSAIKLQSPAPKHWLDFSMGNSLAHISLTINSQKKRLGCALYISDNKDLFEYLKTHEDDLITSIPFKLDWFEANKAAGVNVFYEVSDIFQNDLESNHFTWFYENVLLFKKVFIPLIQEFASQP